MNKARRIKIDKIIESLENINTQIEELADEELESYENMPESLQESERYDASVQAEENLRSAFDNMDGVICSLEDAKGEQLVKRGIYKQFDVCYNGESLRYLYERR